MNPDTILNIIKKGVVAENVPMSAYTTFQVGGPAELFVTPGDVSELCGIIKELSKEGKEYFILGNGSDLLVSDKGFHGVVINLGRNQFPDFSGVCVHKNGEEALIEAGAGVKMSAIGKLAEELSLTGFEPLTGIPGTIGGALAMNAGAYGGEIKDVFFSGTAVDPKGEIIELKPEEMDFGYRASAITNKGLIVTKTVIRLQKGDAEEIRRKVSELAGKRKEKQPLEYPSAGSTFKRPEGFFAGKLIEDAGLKGYRIGGASVSTKHCGFIVNDDHATASDIYDLIMSVQRKVQENSGVLLDPEVKFLGDF